ncbi:MAG: hypothetical protein WBJ21_08855 [Burkholderiaceae bacterium]
MRSDSVQPSQSNSSMRSVDSGAIGTSVRAETKAPQLHTKNHLLQALHADLRNYFLHTQIVRAGSSNLEKAFNLRLYARISKAHQQEVAHFMDQEENAGIRLTSTRWAVPALASFSLVELFTKQKIYAQRVKDLADREKYLYADLSLRAFKRGQITGLKKIAMRSLLMSDTPKHIVVDISAPPIVYDKKHKWNSEFKDFFTGVDKFAEEDEFHCLPEELERILAAGRQLPEISLICRDRCLSGEVIAQFNADQRILSRLQVLDFAGTRFNNDGALILHQNNYIDAINDLIRELAKLIQRSGSVKELYLDRCALYSQHASTLGESLPDMKKLKALSLSENFLANDLITREKDLIGVQQILQAVNQHNTLAYLNLSGNNLGKSGATLVMNLLRENSVIKEVRLGGNRIAEDHPIWTDPRMQNRQ